MHDSSPRHHGIEDKKANQDRKVVPICTLCNEVPEQGIRSGFFLRGVFICHDCEEELITDNSNKQDDYYLAMAKLKKVLFPQ